jgi:hypothetical protein
MAININSINAAVIGQLHDVGEMKPATAIKNTTVVNMTSKNRGFFDFDVTILASPSIKYFGCAQ